ncbi:hypothetical protein N657DRAFT_618496 [Parathielavia appendiculata]|uniref:Uncharacterized protein n=1 Tax=Parathielavia appendiculata TaxID=2587402 RepID=A0AAN6TZG7_9PEZI|nr:hypothetical protein N657DRAFT_618496 [Parathielavia appendiculata]
MFLATAPPSALRASGGRIWLPISSGAAPWHRWFSTSPTHRAKHIITFGETSSPELSRLLDSFRHYIVLPTYLAGEQRKKIYNPKLKDILQNDPVTMEIDGVAYKFRYINRVTELPNTRKIVTQAVNAMTTSKDFQNIPPLLEGCERANRTLGTPIRSSMIRRAAMHRSLHIIMDCVKAVKRTGFKLDHSELINELLIWLQLPAVQSGWDEAKTKVALKQVQLVLNLIESDENHLPRKESQGAFPFYRDPQVLAARLHMAAARAVHHQGGKDVDGKVTKYAQELVALWPEGAGLLDLQPDESYRDKEKMSYLIERNHYLWYASPVLNGLTLAAQVVDPGLAMQLQNRADSVETEVKAALASEKRKPGGRGEMIYNSLFNPQANEEELAAAEETA